MFGSLSHQGSSRVLLTVAPLVGAVALKQWISLTELAGIVLVILAIVLRKP